jgi:hypothetical protein
MPSLARLTAVVVIQHNPVGFQAGLMGNLTFLGLAERVIEEENRPLSPYEIWQIALSKGYEQELRSKAGKTPASTLYSAIMTDVYFEKSRFVKVSKRPARYFLKRLATVHRVGIGSN